MTDEEFKKAYPNTTIRQLTPGEFYDRFPMLFPREEKDKDGEIHTTNKSN